MQGLQIKPRWQPALPSERRSFTAFFQPVFPQLAAFHWVYPDTLPFLGSGDTEFETLIEAVCLEGHIPPDTLLPKYAHFIIDDWADLYGFRICPDVPAVRHRHHFRERYEWLGRTVDVCFFNVDGAWWEIYAKDEALLQAVRQHIASLPDIHVREMVLEQRDALF